MNKKQITTVAQLGAILSSESRVLLLTLAESGDSTVSELAEGVGIAVTTASTQLSRLAALGILDRRKEQGRPEVVYSPADTMLARLVFRVLHLQENGDAAD